MTTKTIVFIHGLFMNPKSWESWKSYFEKNGYTCIIPTYPYHEGEPAELRTKINPVLAKISLEDVVQSVRQSIQSLSEPPILVGHSMGGLIAQKIVNRAEAAAAVCINSAPPKGITSFKWSFLQANFPVINPFKGNSVFMPTLPWFHNAFCHTMDMSATQSMFEKYVVPESRNIPRSSTGREGLIDFDKPHAPLLFIAGELDKIVPASLNQKNFEAYTDGGSVKDFKAFEQRTHFICGQDNWEEVAAYALNWIRSQKI
jgi:pimeloyl-ACP methyl ester carboxylesterase